MRPSRGSLAVLVAVLLMVYSGCGDGSSEGPSQATPKDTMRAMGDCFVAFDREGTLALLKGPEEEMRAAGAMMGFLSANSRFRDDFVRAYGDRAWQEFQDEDGASLTAEFTDERDKIDSMKVVIDGNEATATMPGMPKAMRLMLVDGKWFIRAADVLGSGMPDPGQVRQWEDLTAVIEEHRARIGKPGVEPEQIDRELGAAFGRVFGR